MMYCAEKCVNREREEGNLTGLRASPSDTAADENSATMEVEERRDDTGQSPVPDIPAAGQNPDEEMYGIRSDSIDSELAGLEAELGILATLADAERHRRLIGEDTDVENVELPTVGDTTDEDDEEASSCSDSMGSASKDWIHLQDNGENLDPSKIAALSSAFSNYISTPKHSKGRRESNDPAMGQFLLPLVSQSLDESLLTGGRVSTDQSIMEVLAAEAKKYKKAGDEVSALAVRILKEYRALEMQEFGDSPFSPPKEQDSVHRPEESSQDSQRVMDLISKCINEDETLLIFDELKKELSSRESLEERVQAEFPPSPYMGEIIHNAHGIIDKLMERTRERADGEDDDADSKALDAEMDMAEFESVSRSAPKFADTRLVKNVLRCINDNSSGQNKVSEVGREPAEASAEAPESRRGGVERAAGKRAEASDLDPGEDDEEDEDGDEEEGTKEVVREVEGAAKDVRLEVINKFKFLDSSPLRSTLEQYMMMQIAGREADAEYRRMIAVLLQGGQGQDRGDPPQKIFDCDSVNAAERFISHSDDRRQLCPGGCGNAQHCSRYRKNAMRQKSGDGGESIPTSNPSPPGSHPNQKTLPEAKREGRQDSNQECSESASVRLSEAARFVDLQWAWWEVRALLCAVWHAAGHVAASAAAAAPLVPHVAVATVPPCHCCRCSHRLAHKLPSKPDPTTDRCMCQKRPRSNIVKPRERCKSCIARNAESRLKLLSLLWGRGEPPSSCCCKERRSTQPADSCKVRIFFDDQSIKPIGFDLSKDEDEQNTSDALKVDEESENFFTSCYKRFLDGDEDIPRGDEGLVPLCQRCRCKCGKARFYCPKQRDISITENIDNFTRLAPQLLILRLDTLCSALCARHGTRLARLLAQGAVMTFLNELCSRASAMRAGGVALSGILGPTRRRLATVCGRLLAPHRYLTSIYRAWADRAAATRVVHLSMLLLLGQAPPQTMETLRSFSSLLAMMGEAETLHADVTLFLGNYRQCERDDFLEGIRSKFLAAQRDSLGHAKVLGLLGDDPCHLSNAPEAECSVVSRRLAACLPRDSGELEEFKRIVQAMLLCHASPGGQSLLVSQYVKPHQEDKESDERGVADGSVGGELQYWLGKRRLLEGLLQERDRDTIRILESSTRINEDSVNNEIRETKKTETTRPRPVKRKLKTTEDTTTTASVQRETRGAGCAALVAPARTDPKTDGAAPKAVRSVRASCAARRRCATIANTTDVFRKEKMEYSLTNCIGVSKTLAWPWPSHWRVNSVHDMASRLLTRAKFDSRVCIVNLLPIASNGGFQHVLRWYSCPDMTRLDEPEFTEQETSPVTDAMASLRLDTDDADLKVREKAENESDEIDESCLIGLTSKFIPEVFGQSSGADCIIDSLDGGGIGAAADLEGKGKDKGGRTGKGWDCSMGSVLSADKMLALEALKNADVSPESENQRYLRMQMCECLAKMEILGLEEEAHDGGTDRRETSPSDPATDTPAYAQALDQNRRLLALNHTLRRNGSQSDHMTSLLDTATDIMTQEKNILKELIDFELSSSGKKEELELLDDVNVREPLPFLEAKDLNQLEGTDDCSPLSTPKRRRVIDGGEFDETEAATAKEFEHVMRHISESDSIADLINRLSLHRYPSLNVWNIAEDLSLLTPETIKQLKEVKLARSGKKHVCGKRKNGSATGGSASSVRSGSAPRPPVRPVATPALADPTREEIMLEVLAHRDGERGGFTEEREFQAKLFTASLQVVMRKVLQVVMPCREDEHMQGAGTDTSSPYDVKVGTEIDGFSIDDYWDEIKSHFSSWRAYTLEQYWSLPELYRQPPPKDAHHHGAQRGNECHASGGGGCYVCSDCEAVKRTETGEAATKLGDAGVKLGDAADPRDDVKKRAVKKTVASKATLESSPKVIDFMSLGRKVDGKTGMTEHSKTTIELGKVAEQIKTIEHGKTLSEKLGASDPAKPASKSGNITPVEHALFVEKLQAVNKDYVDKLLRQNFTGEDWILTMNELQKLERKLKSAVGRGGTGGGGGTATRTADETREAELLAGRGLSKLINQFSKKTQESTAKQDLNAKVAKTPEEVSGGGCECAESTKCRCEKATMTTTSASRDPSKEDKQEQKKSGTSDEAKKGVTKEEETGGGDKNKSTTTIKKVVIINNIQGKVKTTTLKTEDSGISVGGAIAALAQEGCGKSGEDVVVKGCPGSDVQVVNGVAMKDGVPIRDGVTIRDIIGCREPPLKLAEAAVKSSQAKAKAAQSQATQGAGQTGQAAAAGATPAQKPSCDAKGDAHHQHVCTAGNHSSTESCNGGSQEGNGGGAGGRCSQHPASPRPGSGDQPCNCCYCTVFGHAPPVTTPVPRNFNETRERLRSILNRKKQRCRPGGSLSSQGESDTSDAQRPSNRSEDGGSGVTTNPPIAPVVKPEPLPTSLSKPKPPTNATQGTEPERAVSQPKTTPARVAKPTTEGPAAAPTRARTADPTVASKSSKETANIKGREGRPREVNNSQTVSSEATPAITTQPVAPQQPAVTVQQPPAPQPPQPVPNATTKDQREQAIVEEQNSKNAKKYKLVACNKSKGIQTDPRNQSQQAAASPAPAAPQQQPAPVAPQQQPAQPQKAVNVKKHTETITKPKAGTARAGQGGATTTTTTTTTTTNSDWQTMTASTTTTTSRDSSVFSTSSVCSGCNGYPVCAEDTRDLDMLMEFIEGPGNVMDKIKKKAKKARQKAKKLVERLKQELSALSEDAAQLRAEAARQEKLLAAIAGKKKTTKKGKKKGSDSGMAGAEEAGQLRKSAREARERAGRAERELEEGRRKLAKVHAALKGLDNPTETRQKLAEAQSQAQPTGRPAQQQQGLVTERQKQPSPQTAQTPNLEQLISSSLHPQAACNGRQEQCMVTIKRVIMPDRNEPSVTITPKGSDKPIYTFQQGGGVSAQSVSDRLSGVSQLQQQQSLQDSQQQQNNANKKKSSTPSWEATLAQINSLSQAKKKPKDKIAKSDSKADLSSAKIQQHQGGKKPAQSQGQEKPSTASSASSVYASRSTSTVSEMSSVDLTMSKKQRKAMERRMREEEEERLRLEEESKANAKKKGNNKKQQQQQQQQQQQAEVEDEPEKIVLSMHQLKTAVKRALEAMEDQVVDSKAKGTKLKDSAKEFIEKVVSKVEETKKGAIGREKVVDISEVVLGSFGGAKDRPKKQQPSNQTQIQQPKSQQQQPPQPKAANGPARAAAAATSAQPRQTAPQTKSTNQVQTKQATQQKALAPAQSKGDGKKQGEKGGNKTIAETRENNGLKVVGGKGTLKCGNTNNKLQNNNNNNVTSKKGQPQQSVTSVHQRTAPMAQQARQGAGAGRQQGHYQQQQQGHSNSQQHQQGHSTSQQHQQSHYQQQQQHYPHVNGTYPDRIHLNSDITIQLATGKEGHLHQNGQAGSQQTPNILEQHQLGGKVTANGGPVSCSIMEQLRNGVQVADLKLPPGITLTWVDPAKKQPDPTPKTAIPVVKLSNVPPEYRPSPPVVAPPALIMVDTKNIQPNRDAKQHQQQAPPPTTGPTNPGGKAKSKKSKKKSNKKAAQCPPNLTQQAETSTHSHHPRQEEPKMVTLRNPMFHPALPAVSVSSVQPGGKRVVGETIRIPDPIPMPPNAACQATITPTSNGMFTIRNPLMSMVHQQSMMALGQPKDAPSPVVLVANPNTNHEDTSAEISGRMADMTIKRKNDEVKNETHNSQVLNLNFTPNKDNRGGYSLFRAEGEENDTNLSPVVDRSQPKEAPSPIGSGNKTHIRNGGVPSVSQQNLSAMRQLDFINGNKPPVGWQPRPEPVGTPRRTDELGQGDNMDPGMGQGFYSPFGQTDPADKLFGSLLFQNSANREEQPQQQSVWSPVSGNEELPRVGQQYFPKIDQPTGLQNTVEISLVPSDPKNSPAPPNAQNQQFRTPFTPKWTAGYPYQEYPPNSYQQFSHFPQPSHFPPQLRSSHSSSSSGLVTGSSGTNSVYDSVSNSSSNSPADAATTVSHDQTHDGETRIDGRNYGDFSPYVAMLQQQQQMNCYSPSSAADYGNFVGAYGVNFQGRIADNFNQMRISDYAGDSFPQYDQFSGQKEEMFQEDQVKFGSYGPIGGSVSAQAYPEDQGQGQPKGLGAIGSHRVTNGVQKGEEYYGVDTRSVFAPDQSITNLNELESTEREIESFKRFDFYFQPPKNKPKINLNLRDIALPKARDK